MDKKKLTLLFIFLIISCRQIGLKITNIDFEVDIVERENHVEINIKNLTKGAENFKWIFSGAEDSIKTDASPQRLIYKKGGYFNIKLIASNNDDDIDSITKEIFIDYFIFEKPFKIEVDTNFHSPVNINIIVQKNNDNGIYHWNFENAKNIQLFEGKNPPKILYDKIGKHDIKLTIKRDTSVFKYTESIEVLPELKADFDYEVDFFDDDYQTPVKIYLKNKTSGAINYNWYFEDSDIGTSQQKEIKEIILKGKGEKKLILVADNIKYKKEVLKTITIFENTNLRELKDVKLGTISSHLNEINSCFFSTKYRKNYINLYENTEYIDIFLSVTKSNFEACYFLSPDNKESNLFFIEGLKKTIYINSLEYCNCSIMLTPEEFDNMKDDSILKMFDLTNIVSTSIDNKWNNPFDSSIKNRIVIFMNSNGIKGAIKIKDFITDGLRSYILVDIKFQKEKN